MASISWGDFSTLNQRAAADVAYTFHLGRDRHNVVTGATLLADTAAAHPLQDLLVGDLQVDHSVKNDAGLVQRFGLGNGPGHTVKDIALFAVFRLQTFVNDANDDLVRNQVAIYSLAFNPIGVPSLTAARRILPVEIVGIPSFWFRMAAWVPLPAPGAPNMIRFIMFFTPSYSRKPWYWRASIWFSSALIVSSATPTTMMTEVPPMARPEMLMNLLATSGAIATMPR